MTDNATNRLKVVRALQAELVGPNPAGREIDVSVDLRFDDYKSARGPFRQLGSGEEILVRDSPTKRYGVGVLFPLGTTKPDAAEAVGGDAEEPPSAEPNHNGSIATEEFDPKTGGVERETDDFDLSIANAYQPSTLGISFLAEFPDASTLVVEATGGRYSAKFANIGASGSPVTAVAESTDAKAKESPRPRTWWLRKPVTVRAVFHADRLLRDSSRPSTLVARKGMSNSGGIEFEAEGLDELDLRIEVFSRPRDDDPRQRLLTVCLVNRSPSTAIGAPNDRCLFQSHFRASVVNEHLGPHILPYPAAETFLDAEEQGLALLYRHTQTYATGHGCAADWEASPHAERATFVSAECMPVTRTRDITPAIRRDDGSELVVEMAPLAGLVRTDDGTAGLIDVVAQYEAWIVKRRAEIPILPTRYRDSALEHMAQCDRAAARMREGLEYLRTDVKARRAFQLANHAILLQQITTAGEPRKATLDAKTDLLTFSRAAQLPDPLNPPPGRGRWRAFQIAFLLATVRSSVEGGAPDRELVDLIWFPTGGGKTEAYLGLASFAMFRRRLDDPSDAGVHVLMRYTLRLLTAQQFQRASSLLCAMEYLRRTGSDALGEVPFSAGIWLGGDTTPNTRADALQKLSKLEGGGKADNPFLLSHCPWCRAQFGRLERKAKSNKSKGLVLGYSRGGGTVRFVCSDKSCYFTGGLPVHVIDEDIYERRPTLIIGTIDKFAMLAWRPQARAIFGLGMDGQRETSPPGLIIQDELHLIAGPLGSLAGLYETVIEDLCTDHRRAISIPPKIVSSTATIRRFRDQIKALYARRDAALFPPPGLSAGDSFFAQYDNDSAGRLYVGVHAASLGSVQTEWVRTYAALMQAPMMLDDTERDPWWTMLCFFNSIREMGTAHTLFQSDIPDYARVVWDRQDTPSDRRRYPSSARVLELTGGLESEQISEAIAALEVRRGGGGGYPVDVCLASSVIEVGIDIPRLALMIVAGQPKTTAQYIQVTGRVGRLKERPGVIVTMYSPSKPRDRSHFERFRSYHERLYANVEPTSVTPFSAPVLDRALHAVLVSYVRQTGERDPARKPDPYPSRLAEEFRELVLKRVAVVDPAEAPAVAEVFDRRTAQWKRWKRTHWERKEEEVGLLRPAGQYASAEAAQLSWATPNSMRNVDAECEAEVTTRYLTSVGEEDGA